MTMQSRRRHGSSSSGELDVFGATSYFAGLPDYYSCPAGEPAGGRRRLMMIQANHHQVTRDTRMEDTYFHGPPHHHLAPDDDDQLGLGVAGKLSSGKQSKLSALLSLMVSPSPRASFRKEPPPLPPASKLLLLAAAGNEPAKVSSSSSSRESSGYGGVHDLDLGVAMGDRRLQGVKVVRGAGGGEERWVVRCSAWDEEHEHHGSGSMLDAESSGDLKDVVAGEEGDGNPGDWESDCSSDLFDLDLLSTHGDDHLSITN